METNDILNLASELHEARMKLEAASTTQKNILEAAKQSHEYQSMACIIDIQKDAIAQAEEALKQEASDYFSSTKNKTMFGGLAGVKEHDNWTIDEDAAKDWVLEHGHTDILKLDLVKLKKLADAITVPGVTSKKEPKAYVASDLSKYV